MHTAAAGGDLNVIRALVKENSDSLFLVDENGWTALQ
jgi:ankyrin repeat protein